MKGKVWIIAVSISVAATAYVGSFFFLLLGQRLSHIEWADDLGLGYLLNYERGPEGLAFYDAPWMKVFTPLSSRIYRRSDDPHETVTLSVYGKLVHYAHCWGWAGYSLSEAGDAVQQEETIHGWTYLDMFPERFENESPDR